MMPDFLSSEIASPEKPSAASAQGRVLTTGGAAQGGVFTQRMGHTWWPA